MKEDLRRQLVDETGVSKDDFEVIVSFINSNLFLNLEFCSFSFDLKDFSTSTGPIFTCDYKDRLLCKISF